MHTKDEITIKISNKDRVYLTIIMCIALIAVLVCILVPRHYYLKYGNQTGSQPPNITAGNTNPGTAPDSPVTDTTPAQSKNISYANTYSTLVINLLKDAGIPYSTTSKHLDEFNILDVYSLNINTNQLTELEELAEPIYVDLNMILQEFGSISSSKINLNNTLHSNIVAFSNLLNNIAEPSA